MHTPVSIYLKVRDMYPQSALMESSDYHAGENSLSFIALCPLANIGMNSGIVTANYPDNSRTEEPLTKTFTVEKAMNRFINQFQVTGENKNVCGLYGYTTFNAVKYFEHIPVKESHDEQNDAPDLLYILYKYIIVFNHFKNELTLVEMLGEGEESGLPELEAAIENRNYASYNFSVTGPVSCHRKIVRSIIPVFNSCFQFRQAAFFPFGQHLYECQFIFEMIEDNYVFV